jgi:16S rRNA (guanine966-N2)-methyltransferase
MTRRRSSTSKHRNSSPRRLRIVAGKWRRRLLHIAPVQGLRPTAARIRETLFNWLAPRIHGARCLDLFAGTGALGFEALSRGAASVTFVEKSRDAVAVLEETCVALGADTAKIYCGDASKYLCSVPHATFDLVFLDPPYADDSLGELCRLLLQSECIAPGAQIYLEQEKSGAPPALPQGWVIAQEKIAGNVRYSLLDTPRPSVGSGQGATHRPEQEEK